MIQFCSFCSRSQKHEQRCSVNKLLPVTTTELSMVNNAHMLLHTLLTKFNMYLRGNYDVAPLTFKHSKK